MKTWKKTVGCLGAAVILSSAVFTWADKETDSALRAAPPAVQAAVVQLAGSDKIDEFSIETADGKQIYDLEFSNKGASYAADIDPSGKILTREVDVNLEIVPPAVMDALKKAHTDGAIGEAAIVTAGDKMFYEFDDKVGKDMHEIQISAGGAVLSDTIEAPEPGETPDKAGAKGGKEEKD